MKVILLDSILGLGKKSQIIDVKPGYARNFLIPKNKGIIATKDNINFLKKKLLEKKSKLLDILNKAKSKLKKFNNIKKIIIKAKSGKNGKLFGSIGKNDILNELKEIGLEISKKEVKLPKGGFKKIGEYNITFQFHEKISVEKIISIVNAK
ncbi:50S ribosomal protein L9 [Enterobacteriaceae endosymbiont of Donacia bicoloricornis]|uniref:50S ribosomal protein L9 n=1 Tax=Enterobacteriaceae endosymbiont of Donacia bicoloricornis TaxID=2675772 RepID=UPI001449EF5B|nr:50S ribosomal protein L9 [Enterobacteriaceae endosymbiont of Donacia bicoloricornis]QJC37849.1 50S ribosomal protein L9 [Enterobacteriaceae endosymbiont of Donacia bicoloricornis]